MREWTMRGVWLLVMASVWVSTGAAQAQCCPGYSAATVCADVTLTKSRWCIQNNVPSGQNALPKAFCSYGDKVVSTLETLFDVPARGIMEFELDSQTGGAHTGTACSNPGVGVAYDAFTGSAYGATGFWGYLLSLHESINDWTGMSSSGWPTDWWADHQSAFPNMMDFHVMSAIGTDNNDANLSKAAAAQKKRFYPSGDSADPKVVALDNVFMAMPSGDGFAGFSKLFALQSGDGVRWDDLGVANPNVKRSEYVVAYMSLAAGKPVLGLLQGPGDNGGGNICNNTPDGTQGDQPYTCSAANVEAIANAHCGLVANGRKMADLTALRGGKYTSVPAGPCAAACPAECGCDDSGHCVAGWLGAHADAGVPDTSLGDAGSGVSQRDAGRDTLDSGRPGPIAAPRDASTTGPASDGGEPEASVEPSDDDGGCGCRALDTRKQLESGAASLVLGLALLLRRRPRRR